MISPSIQPKHIQEYILASNLLKSNQYCNTHERTNNVALQINLFFNTLIQNPESTARAKYGNSYVTI